MTNRKMSLGIITSIEKFYINSKRIIVGSAAEGWSHAVSADKHFIEINPSNAGKTIPSVKNEEIIHKPVINNEPARSAGQTIDYLNEENKIVDKFGKLKALIEYEDLNLINDSFGQDGAVDLYNAQKRTFNNNDLNIVIIGGGVIGLYLAVTLKYTLGHEVNILVLDHRSITQHVRKPFNREWLTYIEADIVQKYAPPNIKGLLGCFGVEGFTGLPINLLETVLMLSCKDQGVQFYFAPKLDYSKLNNKSISLFFDATGGRLNGCTYSKSNPEKIDIKVPEKVNNVSVSRQSLIKITLKACDAYHVPYLKDLKIETHMIKLTHIPISLLKDVFNFIERRNAAHLFYIWKGVLKNEINTGLVFINLTSQERDLLISCIENPVNLKRFLKNNNDIANSLNDTVKSLLQMLVNSNGSSGIKINPPFSYAPYLNLDAEKGRFAGKHIFPIGDAYFCGHPKVGNGLWTHLGFINDLVKKIATENKIYKAPDA